MNLFLEKSKNNSSANISGRDHKTKRIEKVSLCERERERETERSILRN